MKISVRELVQRCPAGVEVLVDADLDRPIRWVHPTELADPTDYLEGGEVILTAGVWMDGGAEPSTVVRNLSRANAASIGFGLTKDHPVVPAELARACRSSGLNLFSVSVNIPFLAIMGVFVDAVTREREAPLTESIRRNERFIRASGGPDPMVALTRALGRYLRAGCHLVQPQGQVMASSEVSAELSEFPEPWQAAFDRNDSSDNRIAFPIGSHAAPDAWLVSAPTTGVLSVEERAAIEQALPFFALAFARRRAVRESARRFAAELVDLLLAGDSMSRAARARIESFELRLDQGIVAVCARVEDVESALDILEDAYRVHGLPATVTTKRGEIVSFVEVDANDCDLRSLLETAFAEIGAAGSDGNAAVGFGEPAADVTGLRKSLIEAQHACLVAWSRPGRGIASYAEVGSHLLLLALQDEEVLGHFRQVLLEPLEEHDARSQVSLLETLDVFLSSGGRWRKSAQDLYIHVNTLRHRLTKVEELTGRDLTSMADRVDFFIALRARDRSVAIA